jgi:hypothetical protein
MLVMAVSRSPDEDQQLGFTVALLWAVWHMPDHFADEGLGVEALISAPVIFAVEFFSVFFARALFV